LQRHLSGVLLVSYERERHSPPRERAICCIEASPIRLNSPTLFIEHFLHQVLLMLLGFASQT
jgi:hypothetical protein